ncbi:MAG TPA: long-chain fatty acid--CoA ligase, partial [Aigarchaeota archaeon]|nr:long-chain fatty acid--CoA ligase [Aigarchaeota archaeon]
MNTLEMAFNRIWVKNYPRDVSPDITIPDNKSVYDLFEEAASRFSGNTAVIFLDSRYSFRELLGYVERMSAALRRLGVGKGDRVAIYLPNSIQFIIAYYATLRLGAVVTPMNPLYSP